MTAASPVDDPRLPAAVDLLSRTGTTAFGLRFQDDDEPVVWIAIGSWGHRHHEVAAALDPVRATLRLCAEVIDGNICKRCRRPTGFEPDLIDTLPLLRAFCWYQYDPELKTYRRGCAGDDG